MMNSFSMKNYRLASVTSLIGILLAIFAFSFGPWLGSRSGLWIMAELGRLLLQADGPGDFSRQQKIFTILALIALILVGLVIAYYREIRTNKRQWTMMEILLALTAVILLSVLFFTYDAQTVGLLMTTLGCILVGASALALHISNEETSYPSRAEAIAVLARKWAEVFKEARLHGWPVAIMSVRTHQPLRRDAISQLKNELRIRDLVFPVRDGLIILLWKADPDLALALARQVHESVVRITQGPCWIGLASFPGDGDQLLMLLREAQQASEVATASRKSIIPFSNLGRDEATALVASTWENRLEAARANQSPLAVMVFHTERSLTSDEVALINQELRAGDRTFPIRDGLFVLLSDVHPQNAAAVSRRLQQILRDQMGISSQVGVACYPGDGDRMDILLRRAEITLHETMVQNDRHETTLVS